MTGSGGGSGGGGSGGGGYGGGGSGGGGSGGGNYGATTSNDYGSSYGDPLDLPYGGVRRSFAPGQEDSSNQQSATYKERTRGEQATPRLKIYDYYLNDGQEPLAPPASTPPPTLPAPPLT